MGMFSHSDADKLKYALEIGYLEIIFGNDDIIKEFTLEDKGNKGVKIMVRNRKDDGANGEPIPHPTPTIKFIRGTEFKHDGMLGVPFEFEEGVKLYKDADNNRNKSKLSNSDMKLINTFIKQNKDDLIEYWYLDSKKDNGAIKKKELEDRINSRYKKMKK